jgi:pentatricopeptide repeat protein
MAKKLAILQSNYIPWKGYFDLINSVDEFVLYDDMQFTRRDWRNRNKIKTQQGTQWLTIPVVQERGHHGNQRICDTQVADKDWGEKHWNALLRSYARSRYFDEFKAIFRDIYADDQETHLSRLNFNFISAINAILGIKTKLSWSSDYRLEGDRTERLANICVQAGADVYVTGPSALAYMEPGVFLTHNITVKVADYSGYPAYAQPFPPFDHFVTILDLIFGEGYEAVRFMKTFGSEESRGAFLHAAVASVAG